MTASVDIVMGACFGDEGKGGLANWLSHQKHYDICLGPFGCQSSHTYYRNRQKIEGHHISAGWETSDISYIPAASVINPKILLEEYEMCERFKPNFKLVIHPLATITYGEVESPEFMNSGSMGFGISKARADRLLRKGPLAVDVKELWEFTMSPNDISKLLRVSDNILIESGQGYGLSFTGNYYPYVSSTINTPYGVLANAGIPWNSGTVEVYMVMRPYLIRTPLPPGGNNGQLKNECSAQELGLEKQIESWGQYAGREIRYAPLDPDLIQMAITECNPTYLVLSWADWLIAKKGIKGIYDIENTIGHEFDFLGINLTEFIHCGKWTNS